MVAIGRWQVRKLPRRRCVLGAVLLVGVFAGGYLFAVGAAYVVLPFPGSFQAACDRVSLGWTRTQVKGVLGMPDGYGYLNDDPILLWDDEDGTKLMVVFNAKGEVTHKRYTPNLAVTGSVLTPWERVKLRVTKRLWALRR
jgi:hypothetical protein